jgi:succinate dehydrogenase / fumarate reductase iron-sulfur subunit
MRTLKLRILRGSPTLGRQYQTFTVTLPDEANIIDGVEQIFGHQDHSLMFRHACHHASCGLCGARVNGRERLMCITPVSEFPDGATVTLEPLRNFPWVGDLAVDVKPLLQKMDMVGLPYSREDELADSPEPGNRFEDCIECGLCMSACPVVGSSTKYLGPAPLAGLARLIQEPREVDFSKACALGKSPHGVWRCHSAMECTEVCPSDVDPSQAIGWLRRFYTFKKK